MIIAVRVKTGAREDSIIYNKEASLCLVSVKARPLEGEANEAIIKLLSVELNIPKSCISLKSGLKSRKKLFEIN